VGTKGAFPAAGASAVGWEMVGATAVGDGAAAAVGARATGARGTAGATGGLARVHRLMSNFNNLQRSSFKNKASDGMGASVKRAKRNAENDRRNESILQLVLWDEQ
jgi:hypothetical protein